MKLSIVSILLATSAANAWTVPKSQPVMKPSTTASEGKLSVGWVAAAAFAGWTVATAPMASAVVEPPVTPSQPTMMIAAGAYQAEDSYFSTDFSLPKYNNENSEDLLGTKGLKLESPGKEKAAKSQKQKAPPKEETPEQKAAREEKEAKAAVKAAEREQAEIEKKRIKYEKYQEDLAKQAAKKAELAERQQLRKRN